MRIHYNVTGAERKRLVNDIAGFLGCESVYLGAPTFAYKVGYITVGRNGEVSCEDHASLEEELDALKTELQGEGFVAGESEKAERIAFAAEIPLEKADTEKLTRILDAKGELIQKALGADRVEIEITRDAVRFPWFDAMPDADEAKAYADFIAALCRMSKEQVRVTAAKKAVENEKYAFRCFLLRLGFIGEEYKRDRKILLKNLSGSSAFKRGARREAAADDVSGQGGH